MRKSLLLLIIGWLKWMAPALGAAPATRPVTPVDGREILAFNSGQTPIEPPDTLAPPDSRYSSGSFSSKKIFFEKKKKKASTNRLWRQKDGTGKTDALAVVAPPFLVQFKNRHLNGVCNVVCLKLFHRLPFGPSFAEA